MAMHDCEYCGHEMDEKAVSCSFCGAPRMRKSMFSWPPSEPVKWIAVALLVYGIFHIAFRL